MLIFLALYDSGDERQVHESQSFQNKINKSIK